jgi:membrane-associated PAP2 superfamily phosphatase
MIEEPQTVSPETRAAPRPKAGPIAVGVIVVVGFSAFFYAFPEVDLWASRAFYLPGHGFFLAADRGLAAFRSSADVLVAVAAGVLLLSLAVKLVRPDRPSPIAPNKVLFLLWSLVLGPGLLVNLILKDHWGRPRPTMVSLFGGGSPYVPVWEISGFCSRNCSFVAGEASTAAWLVGVALVLPARWRVPGVVVAGVYALLIGLNRIAFGGHFLSDVLLSFSLTFLLMALLYRLLVERPPAALAGPALEAKLAGFGRWLRRTERSTAAKR